jgi:hypothetical protein
VALVGVRAVSEPATTDQVHPTMIHQQSVSQT